MKIRLNENEEVVTDQHRLEALDHRLALPRPDSKRGVVRQRRRQLRGGFEKTVDLRQTAFGQGVHPCKLVLRHPIPLHQTVHVKAVADLRGNTSRRSVGLLEIPEGFQLCHLVSDGSRGKGDLLVLRQVFGANGLPFLDMGLDDSL